MFRLNGAPPGHSGGVNQVWLDRSGRDLATGMLGEYLGGGSVGQNWESLNALSGSTEHPGASHAAQTPITLVFQQ